MLMYKLTKQVVYKFKAKLLDSTAADGHNSIATNATIAVPLKYLSNF